MKKVFSIIIAIIVTVSLQGCGNSQPNNLDSTAKLDGVVLSIDGEKGWTPDEKVIEKFETKLIPYVNCFKSSKVNKTSVQFVRKNIKKYKRQYVGRIVDGRKILFCNFILIDGQSNEFKDWKTKLIQVLDGGPKFFQVNYDVEKNKFFEFYINGYA